MFSRPFQLIPPTVMLIALMSGCAAKTDTFVTPRMGGVAPVVSSTCTATTDCCCQPDLNNHMTCSDCTVTMP